MSGQLEILCGTAGSGKTARLLAEYRVELGRLLANTTPGQAVWIAPTNRSCRAVVHALPDASLRACFSPNVLTFDAFAERILRTTGQEITPLSMIARRMLALSVIDDARADGTLEYYAPIAESSGFLDLLLALITELKRDEIWPEDLDAACRTRGSARKDAELSLLYGRYQQRLTDLALYDAEGRFWSARTILSGGERGAFRELSLVVIDGFTDFTHAQYEILEHLAGCAQRMLISLPLESPLVRTDLFAKSATALDQIRRRCPSTTSLRVTHVAGPLDHPGTAVEHIAAHLFDNPRDTLRRPQAAALYVIEAAGPAGEVRGIAERIKELLIGGVAPDEIVVAVRSLDDYADLFSETLTAAGIPHWCDAGTRLSRTPLAKSLLAVLQLELEDWTFDRLAAVLRSNYFRPRWNSFRDRTASEATVKALRRWKLGADRRRILARLSTLATAATANDDGTASARADGKTKPAESAAAVASALLNDLSHATERLRRPANFVTWVERVVTLSDELGMSPGPTQSSSASERSLDVRDLGHWHCLQSTLYDAARMLSLLHNDREMTLAVFAKRLRDVLDAQTLPPSGSEVGKVLILESPDARNLDIPHLFMAGLTEASFPRSRQDDCLYGETERRQFVRQGLLPGGRSSQQQDEMLLFYTIVTRARRSLTLSYPAVSPSGQPLFPSPYVTAVRELFADGAIRLTRQNDLDPIPARDRLLTAADLRLSATEALRTGEPGLFRAMVDRHEDASAARNILAGAAMADSRFEQNGFTGYEGLLRRDANLRRLNERFPSDYQFSATQLEGYATCPFRFLLSHVLNVAPPESADSQVDARLRGEILHRVLAHLHAPSENRGVEDVAETLRALIDEHFPAASSRAPFEETLFAVERRFLESLADVYAEQWSKYRDAHKAAWDEPPEPAFVELPFGDAPGEAIGVRGGGAAYLAFGAGPREIRLRGRIDRIDAGRIEGRAVFNVIDYKTRTTHQFKVDDVRSGTALQLAVYMLAVMRGGIIADDAVPYQMAYWNLSKGGFIAGLKGSGKNKPAILEREVVGEIVAALDEVLPRIVTGIRSGDFPVHNADTACTSHCPYHTVCRVNQIRSLADEREKRWSFPTA